jgi:hypothetical protein
MVVDYQAIRAGDYRRCGTEIGRIGPMLLAEQYHHCTHFNFQLPENAEDALAHRSAARMAVSAV